MRVLVVLLILLATLSARAHDPYPVIQDLTIVHGPDGPQPVVFTNFGMIRRDPDGEWRLTCEDAISPGVVLWHQTQDGQVLAGHSRGFVHLGDGCGFEPAEELTRAVRWIGRTVLADGVTEGIVLLLGITDPGRNVVRSTDGGATFHRVPVPEDVAVISLQADPNRPSHLLATAQDGARAFWLLSSDDAGDTWERQRLEQFSTGSPRVLSTRADAIYLRLTAPGQHQVWRSRDEGQTFEKVLEPAASAIFVTQVSATEVWTSGGQGEVYRSLDGGDTWDRQEGLGDVVCLHADGDHLFACVNDLRDYVAVIASSDRGLTWGPYLHYRDLVGPAGCAAETVIGSVCPEMWIFAERAFQGLAPDDPDPVPGDPAPPDGKRQGCFGSSALLALLPLGLLRRRFSVDRKPCSHGFARLAALKSCSPMHNVSGGGSDNGG